MSVARPALTVAASLLALGAAPSGQTTHSYTGGDLGGSITYALGGPAGEVFLHLPSFGEGPLPLSPFFPSSPLVATVGLDLLALAQVGLLSGGSDPVVYGLPPDPTFLGVTLNAQFVTFDLVPTPTAVSPRVSCTLGLAGSSHYVRGTPITGLQPASVVVARRGHSATALADGRVLVAGGEQPDSDDPLTAGYTALSSAELFDPQTETYSLNPAAMTQARSAHTATTLSDGRVLLTGGFADSTTGVASATAEVFDPGTNTFTPTGPMALGRQGHTATLLGDGRILVVGGASTLDLSAAGLLTSLATATNGTELYDPVTNTWALGPPLDLPLVEHRAVPLPSGRALILGGLEVQTIFGQPVPTFSNRARAFDPSTASISELAPLPVSASSPGPQGETGVVAPAVAVLANGKVLSAGGLFGQFVILSLFTLTGCHVYDEATNTWATVAPLTTPRSDGTIVVRGSDVLAVGGLSALNLVTGVFTAETGIDVTTTTVSAWSSVGGMGLPRPEAVPLATNGGNRVLAVGVGINGTGGTAGDTVDRSSEYYTP